MSDPINKTSSNKPAGSPAQAKEAFDKISTNTAQAASLLKDSYATAVKGAQEYNSKVMEFAQTNSEAAFGFAQSLSGIKSPSDFITLSTEHSRKQIETLAEQSRELAALVQKISLASTEPLKTGVTKAFSQAA
jgi:phasin